MKKKLLFVLFAVLTLAMGATAATSSVIERTGKSIKKERTAPARQVAKANADKSPTVYGWLRYVEHAPSDQQYGVCRFNAGGIFPVNGVRPQHRNAVLGSQHNLRGGIPDGCEHCRRQL